MTDTDKPRPKIGKKVVTSHDPEDRDNTTQPGMIETPVNLPTITRDQQQKVAEEWERQGRLRIYRPEP